MLPNVQRVFIVEEGDVDSSALDSFLVYSEFSNLNKHCLWIAE